MLILWMDDRDDEPRNVCHSDVPLFVLPTKVRQKGKYGLWVSMIYAMYSTDDDIVDFRKLRVVDADQKLFHPPSGW